MARKCFIKAFIYCKCFLKVGFPLKSFHMLEKLGNFSVTMQTEKVGFCQKKIWVTTRWQYSYMLHGKYNMQEDMSSIHCVM